MAGMFMVDPRKKPAKHMERGVHDGLTGMGAHTKKHFIEVQQKMRHYVESQQPMEWDGNRLHPQMQHHHQPFPHAVVDGRRSPNSRGRPLTPVAPRRQMIPTGFATPQMDRRQRRASPRPPVR